MVGIVLGEIGAALQSEGRLDRAAERHAEAIAIHLAEKSLRAEGVDRSFLAVAIHRGGDPARAVALHEAALAIHRRTGYRRLEGAELLHLGFCFHELGEPQRARQALDDARQVLAAAGARGLEALAIVLLARLAMDEGDSVRARIALAEAVNATPPGWARLEAMRLVVDGHLAFAPNPPSAVRAYRAALAASRAVEVGFEALTPAYLALALEKSGEDAGEAWSSARELVARVQNPHIAEALAILQGGPASAPGMAASSEVRRALRMAGKRRALVIADEARSVLLPDGSALDLSRRKSIRRLLLGLAQARRDSPGQPLSAETLIELGWPGERMRAEAATKRLHTAIWTLRSLGLEAILISSEAGYLIDPKLALELR
jgi:tetratricopeptide (TPR) repeat protein